MPQSTVRFHQSPGKAGDIYDNSPRKVTSLRITSTTNPVGSYYTRSTTDENECQVGGTGPHAGILVNPNASINFGTASGTLKPTMNVPKDTENDIMSAGHVFVNLTGAVSAALDSKPYYVTATGALGTVSANANAPSGGKLIPNSRILFFGADPVNTASTGLAVLEIR